MGTLPAELVAGNERPDRRRSARRTAIGLFVLAGAVYLLFVAGAMLR